MPCSYAYARDTRQAMRALPGLDRCAWLTGAESDVHARMENTRRREQWFLGRVLAKKLILSQPLHAIPVLRPRDIHIQSKDGLGRAVRPRVYFNGQLFPCSISIAHSDRSVIAALSMEHGTFVGADVTPIQQWDSSFQEMWLTPTELKRLASEPGPSRMRSISGLWSIKEGFYKACNEGEGFRPDSIDVEPKEDGRWRCRAAGSVHDVLLSVDETDEEVAVVVVVRLAPARGWNHD